MMKEKAKDVSCQCGTRRQSLKWA